jgi:hypothetical protein
MPPIVPGMAMSVIKIEISGDESRRLIIRGGVLTEK